MGELLLPSNVSAWERALEATSAERWPLPVDLIRAVTRPDECPAELLGYLAWARSVDIWREEWPIELKRHVTARAILDQRLKGTLALHQRYLSYAGASIIRAITPPNRFVLGRRRTEAEVKSLLSAMPEIRIYREAPPRHVPRRAVWGRFHYSRSVGWSSGAAVRVHEERAMMISGSTVTLLRIAEIDPGATDADLAMFSRLYIPHAWGGARILGAGHGKRQRSWGRPGSTAWVVSFTAGDGARRTVSRSYHPAEAAPETIMSRHASPAGKAWVGRRGSKRRWYRRSAARAHVYDRLRLWDEKAATASRRKRAYWSWSWRGMPTHSAVLAIGVATRAKPRKRWWGRAFAGAMRPHDGAALSAALEAVAAASLPHETILVDLNTAFERRFYGA